MGAMVETMRIEYALTLDDYFEANAAYARARGHRGARRKIFSWVMLLGGMFLIFVLILLSPDQTAGEPKPPAVDVLSTLIPVLPWTIFFFVMMGINQLRRVKGTLRGNLGIARVTPAHIKQAALPWILIGALLVVGWLMLALQEDLNALGKLLLFAIPFLVIASVAGMFANMIHRRTLHGLWEGQPSLSRRTTVTVEDESITFADHLVNQRYSWLAILAFQEAHVWLLYISDYSFYIIPKAAFASVEEADAFRRILDISVGSRTSAFPVLPLPPPEAKRPVST